MLKRSEIRLAVLGVALLGTASAWYLISPLFTSAMEHAVFPTLGFMPSRTPRPATETPLPSATSLPTADLGQSLLVDTASVELIAHGEFYELGHSGQGSVAIYKLADGSLVLHLENFQVDEGEELHVVVSSQETIDGANEARLDAMIDLGPLKASAGDQNYLVPIGLDLTEIRSVLIWSAGASEAFIGASLQAP
jgi:hypothetical protein